MWLKDHGIKAFFTASQNKSFSDGAISCMNLAGLGKLTPNMVLMGFKVQIWHQSVFYLCLTAKDCFSPFLLVHDSVWDALCFASGWLGVWSWGSRGVHQRDASCIWHQHGHGGTKVRLVQLFILYFIYASWYLAKFYLMRFTFYSFLGWATAATFPVLSEEKSRSLLGPTTMQVSFITF